MTQLAIAFLMFILAVISEARRRLCFFSCLRAAQPLRSRVGAVAPPLRPRRGDERRSLFKNSETVQEVGRFRRAIQFSYDYAATRPYDRLDALMVVGDMTDHGNDNATDPL